jgi:nicotinate-nucleotide pyrophosphorylase (carboxylating)
MARARAVIGYLVKFEVEVDTLDQRATTEASGRITVETAPAVAATGVDLISVGWITHSAPILGLGLDC